MIDRSAPYGNRAARYFIVFCNQVQDGRLAGAGIPHNGGQLLIRHSKGSLF